MKRKNNKRHIEEQLLNNNPDFSYEDEIEKQIAQEMKEAKELREKNNTKNNFILERDISKLSKDVKFDKHSVYKIFNRQLKTETFVNGEQAQSLMKYIDNYVVMFDHRRIEN